MYKGLSALIGALIAVMVLLNGELAGGIGNYASSVFIHLSGLVLICLMLWLSKSKTPFQKHIPPVLLLGGAVGFITVVMTNISFSSLGVSLTLALSLLGQTFTAVLIDHNGWFGSKRIRFDLRQIWSLALIVGGIAAMVIL